MISKIWTEIPEHYPSFMIDEFVVMPNHFHGIVWKKEGNKYQSNSVGAGPVPA